MWYNFTLSTKISTILLYNFLYLWSAFILSVLVRHSKPSGACVTEKYEIHAWRWQINALKINIKICIFTTVGATYCENESRWKKA